MAEIDQWPASSVELVALDTLKAAAANSRIHSDEQIAQIAASIKKFGWTIPVLVDEDGVLIAGHARVLAAEGLEIERVPVMVAKGWTDAQKEAYQITDNRLAETATWDNDILTAQIKRLASMEFDLDVLGFNLDDFDLDLGLDPNLAPTIDPTLVTAEGVQKAKQAQDEKFAGAANRVAVPHDVTCPFCGKDFEVDL